MIQLIEALNYKCLRNIHQELGSFHVLVGPNASGKTTFLDVINFLGALVSNGPEEAVAERTKNFSDLLWHRQGKSFELAIEATIPNERKALLKKGFDAIRYEVSIGFLPDTDEVGILEERISLKPSEKPESLTIDAFPRDVLPPDSILSMKSKPGVRTILSKSNNGNDNYYSEVVEESGKGWFPSIRLGPRKSALGNLLEDETRFPVSTWLKNLLTTGVQVFILNSQKIRLASPPGQIKGFRTDGSNLPWVIDELKTKSKPMFDEWLTHVRTVLPDLVDIDTIERQDDRHRYLMLSYKGGITVPSWMASDGTLRLLALTLPAYLPGFRGVYLIEEPENGIHPKAVEAVHQSLSSVYDAQILLASHSPVMLSVVNQRMFYALKKPAAARQTSFRAPITRIYGIGRARRI